MYTLQDLYDWREATAEISGTDLHYLFQDLVGDLSPSGRIVLDIERLRELAETNVDAASATAALEQPAGHWASLPNYFDRER